jgi:hypothetical protein
MMSILLGGRGVTTYICDSINCLYDITCDQSH